SRSALVECERDRARGLETQSCPRTGLLMTSDVTGVPSLSPGSGEGPHQVEHEIDRGEVRVVSHQTHGLPDLWFLMTRGDRSHRLAPSLVNSVPNGST